MIDKEKQVLLAKYRLKQAKESIEEAEFLFQGNKGGEFGARQMDLGNYPATLENYPSTLEDLFRTPEDYPVSPGGWIYLILEGR